VEGDENTNGANIAASTHAHAGATTGAAVGAAPARERGSAAGPRKEARGGASLTGGRGVSNAKLIRNALRHVCLAGVILEPQRNRALEALDQHPGGNFVILFNSSNALTFRGLYILEGGGLGPKDTAVRKVLGAGPAVLR
jgi:hypothetical protein